MSLNPGDEPRKTVTSRNGPLPFSSSISLKAVPQIRLLRGGMRYRFLVFPLDNG